MLDKTSGSRLVECHCALFRLDFQVLDFIKVLLHACEFTENGVLFRIDAVESEVSWENVSRISVFDQSQTYKK